MSTNKWLEEVEMGNIGAPARHEEQYEYARSPQPGAMARERGTDGVVMGCVPREHVEGTAEHPNSEILKIFA